jgi:NitT/TauT family transport system substrate-binding protein
MKKQDNTHTASLSTSATRRTVLKAAAASLAGLSVPSVLLAQTSSKIQIGYWPVASGLPFFVAVDKGYFKEAGLTVEAVKFASPQQVAEAMLAGRLSGSSNGTASAALGIAELAQPNLLKIICTNPTNAKYVLDEFIVAKDSSLKSISQLSGKKIGCGPGIQNVTLTKTVLERAKAVNTTVIELPIAQHVAAIAANQIDACYTLEPTGTVGRLKGITRNLEVGVIARYVLGDEMAPWHGGSASLTTEFIQKNPELTKRYIAAYKRGVDLVKTAPAEARPSLKGYTAIEGDLTNEVPISDYLMATDFTASDTAYFQKFFDLFLDKGIFSRKITIENILYKA